MKLDASEGVRFAADVPYMFWVISSNSSEEMFRRRARFSMARICATEGLGTDSWLDPSLVPF